MVVEAQDAIELFIKTVEALTNKSIKFTDSLEEIVLKVKGDDLAYVDNRRDAQKVYKYDFWKELKKNLKSAIKFKILLKDAEIQEKLLYSKSECFPDFLLKAKAEGNRLISGSLLELKDSKGGSIASFNSTLPTKFKSLEEIDVINGIDLVSKIAGVMEGNLAKKEDYKSYQRKCLYLVRTNSESPEKVKLSVVDGSFFETVPKEDLIYQMFMNILKEHFHKKQISINSETLDKLKDVLSKVTDQTIIAKSQEIEKASIRPRLRIMAEVHSEGNPHSSTYPEIVEGSFNLILGLPNLKKEESMEYVKHRIPGVKVFTIKHKRNGEHLVFQHLL